MSHEYTSYANKPASRRYPSTDAGDDLRSQPRVLCVVPYAPAGLTSGGSIRRRRLAEAVCGIGPSCSAVLHDMDEQQRAELGEQLGSEIFSFHVGRRTRTLALRHWLRHPAIPWSLARLELDAADSEFSRWATVLDPAIVWCAGVEGWLALPEHLKQRAVVDFIDLPSRNRWESARASLRMMRRSFLHRRLRPSVPAAAKKFVVHTDAAFRSLLLQRRVASSSLTIIVSSAQDGRRHDVRHVRNGFDDPGPPNVCDSLRPITQFVFPATFAYEPNLDGAQWFAESVTPLLRRALPGTRSVFAGSSRSDLDRLGADCGIVVTGYLENMGEAFGPGTVVVVPLLARSGTRLKIIEAWARGLPVVSTSKGAEGLGAVDGENLLIADDPRSFAAACVRLAGSATLRRQLTEAGRRRYEAEFTWAQIGNELAGWLAKQID